MLALAFFAPFAGGAARGASSGFVYETQNEFISSGDFNADTRIDVIILDKSNGNARIGYQDAAGALQWGGPLSSGVAQPTGLGIGRFLQSDRDALAVTSPEYNRLNLLNATTPSNAPPPAVLTLGGIGPYSLVGLRAPYGTVSPSLDFLTIASAYNGGPAPFQADLYAMLGGPSGFHRDRLTTSSSLGLGNSIQLGADITTLFATVQRGTNDTFFAYSFRTQQLPLHRPDLPPGSHYAFGRFNNETYPRFLFYVPGQFSISVQRITESAGVFTFTPPTATIFPAAVQSVFYVDEDTDGLVVIQFGDGAIGARLPSGGNQLQSTYNFGNGGAGNVPSGAMSLGNGRFALLSRNANLSSSGRAQVFTRSGSDYIQTSSSELPATSTRLTRENVWLFAREPFVNAQPAFVASLNGGEWITALSGLPGFMSAVSETDRGTTSGLGNPASRTLGLSPANATFAAISQYHPAISLFSYFSPRPVEPVQIAISPPPGHYAEKIIISFTTGPGDGAVHYSLGGTNAYQQYAAPFLLASNAQVQFYGISGGARSSLQLADYTFGAGGFPSVVATNGAGATNPPPDINPSNTVPTYAYGTVIYGRINNSMGQIWAIHMDGSGDRFITQGARPRISRDGRYLAFVRENSPFANTANVWVRDLMTGQEARLFVNPNTIVGFDWDRATGTNLFLDHSCQLWRLNLAGAIAPLPLAAHCRDDAPVQNPVDGRLAFHNLDGNAAICGLYLTTADYASKQRLPIEVPWASWPAWSPDGDWLSFADFNDSPEADGGRNLWVFKLSSNELHPITGLSFLDGFYHGAVWSPTGNELVGAGTVGGVDGIWVIPLSEDRTTCAGVPRRLPTTPGNLMDFVGAVFVPPAPPELAIRREPAKVVVFWQKTLWAPVLESSSDVSPSATWTTVNGPHLSAGLFWEHSVPAASLESRRFYRLRH